MGGFPLSDEKLQALRDRQALPHALRAATLGDAQAQQTPKTKKDNADYKTTKIISPTIRTPPETKEAEDVSSK
jgi:hypothetical protein